MEIFKGIENAEESKDEIMPKDKVIEDLKNKVLQFELAVTQNDKNSEILSKLFEAGVINGEGELIHCKSEYENE